MSRPRSGSALCCSSPATATSGRGNPRGRRRETTRGPCASAVAPTSTSSLEQTSAPATGPPRRPARGQQLARGDGRGIAAPSIASNRPAVRSVRGVRVIRRRLHSEHSSVECNFPPSQRAHPAAARRRSSRTYARCSRASCADGSGVFRSTANDDEPSTSAAPPRVKIRRGIFQREAPSRHRSSTSVRASFAAADADARSSLYLRSSLASWRRGVAARRAP